MVIPAHLAEEIAEVCSGMEEFEAFVLEEVLAGSPIIGLYPCTKDESQKNLMSGLKLNSQKLYNVSGWHQSSQYKEYPNSTTFLGMYAIILC